MSRHLLISARDPGAAAHLGQVAKAAQASPDWQVSLLVAPPAVTMMQRLGLPHRVVRAQGETLAKEAARLLDEIKPDVLLTGLSGPDSGLDEALLQAADGLPRYLFQDYWGDLNPATPAEVSILCLDAEGVCQTRQRFGRPARAIGSPAHDAWPKPRLARARLRRHHRLGKRSTVAGLCEQPLWGLSAYRHELRRALQGLRKGRLLLRPHPRSDWKARLGLRRVARISRVRVDWSDRTPLPDFIAGCDLILSAFSNCALDAVHCNALPGHSGTVVINLLSEPALYHFYREATGFEQTPLAAQGLAIDITHRSRCVREISRALQPSQRRHARDKARSGRAPGSAAEHLLHTLMADLI